MEMVWRRLTKDKLLRYSVAQQLDIPTLRRPRGYLARLNSVPDCSVGTVPVPSVDCPNPYYLGESCRINQPPARRPVLSSDLGELRTNMTAPGAENTTTSYTLYEYVQPY